MSGTTDRAHEADPEVWYVRPVFFVADGEAALAFYKALGFEESWRFETDGRLDVFQVARNDLLLILERRGDRAGGGRLFFELFPEKLEEFLHLATAAGIRVEDGRWGMPIKTILDPDGNELYFSLG